MIGWIVKLDEFVERQGIKSAELCKIIDGIESEFAQLESKLDRAVKALEKLGKTGDGSHKYKHASFFDCLPTLQIELEERINFARLALEEIKK